MSNFNDNSVPISYSLSGLQNINVNTINGLTPFNGVSANANYPLAFNATTGVLSQTPIGQQLETTSNPTFATVTGSTSLKTNLITNSSGDLNVKPTTYQTIFGKDGSRGYITILADGLTTSAQLLFYTPDNTLRALMRADVGNYYFYGLAVQLQFLANTNVVFNANFNNNIANQYILFRNGVTNIAQFDLNNGLVMLNSYPITATSETNLSLNVFTGQTINLKVNSTSIATISGTGLNIQSGYNISTDTIDTTGTTIQLFNNTSYGRFRFNNINNINYAGSLLFLDNGNLTKATLGYKTAVNDFYLDVASTTSNLYIKGGTVYLQTSATTKNIECNTSINIPTGSTYKINGTSIYIPNQSVDITSNPTFNSVNIPTGSTYKINNVAINIPNQAVNTTSNPTFNSVKITDVGTIYDNTLGSLIISTNYSTGTLSFNIGSTIVAQMAIIGTSPYTSIKGTLSTPSIETDTIVSQYGTVSFSSNDIQTYSGLKLANTSTIYKASLAGSFATSQNYTLYMPSALPSVGNLPLICGTGGGLSYNDQALKTTNDVTFNKVTTSNITYSGGVIYMNNNTTNSRILFQISGVSLAEVGNIGNMFYPYVSGYYSCVYETNVTNQYWTTNVSGTTFEVLNGAGIGLYINYGDNFWTQTSDISLKKNIEPLKSSLNIINKLNPITYNWKDDTMPKKQIGFIAQEMQEILPELVNKIDDDGHLGIATTGLIPFLVKSIQELATQLNEMNHFVSNICQEMTNMKEILMKNNLI